MWLLSLLKHNNKSNVYRLCDPMVLRSNYIYANNVYYCESCEYNFHQRQEVLDTTLCVCQKSLIGQWFYPCFIHQQNWQPQFSLGFQ